MARYRKCSMISAIALAASLTACGGGGGGSGPNIASIPPPPPPPPPTPAGVVGAAAMAVVPNANLFPTAVDGGPTIKEHAATVFPLLQSVVTTTSTGLAADTAIMNGGATIAFAAQVTGRSSFSISVPALGISDLALVASGAYSCSACGSSNGKEIELNIAVPAKGDLNWTTYGSWSAIDRSSRTTSMFVTGYETPAASVPTMGTATYNGSVAGEVSFPQAGSQFGVRTYASLSGDAALLANFASGSISGNLTNMTSGGVPWNSVSLVGSIAGGQNSFSGTSAATSAPGGIASLSGSATGTFAGRFFGPIAQELGAIWTLFDGRATAVGSIVAKKGP